MRKRKNSFNPIQICIPMIVALCLCLAAQGIAADPEQKSTKDVPKQESRKDVKQTPAGMKKDTAAVAEAQRNYDRITGEKEALEKRVQAMDKALAILPATARKLSETCRGIEEIQMGAPAAADWPALADLGKRSFDGPGIKTTLAKFAEEMNRLPREAYPARPAEDAAAIQNNIAAVISLSEKLSATLAMDAAATSSKLAKDKPNLFQFINSSGDRSAAMLLQVKVRQILAETAPLLEQTKAADRSIDSLNRGLQANGKSARTELAKMEGQIQYLLGSYPIKRKGEKKP